MDNYLLLAQKTRMALNEMDSNVNVGYSKQVFDILLNEGIIMWFFDFTKGLETTQDIHDKLGNLVVRTPANSLASAPGYQTPLNPANIWDTEYEFRFDDLDFPYYRYMASYVMMKFGDCPAARGKVRIEQHDDLDTVLIDEFRKPNWRYKRVVGVFSKDSRVQTAGTANDTNRSLTIYTDGEFTIDTLHITYLKTPNVVSFGGYTDLDGNLTIRTECDIPPIYYDEIVTYIMAQAQKKYGFTNNK